jgi:hypothetical protein
MDRTTGVFTLCHVVCRLSRKEAEDYYQYYSQENAARNQRHRRQC